jgi:protocatechuate 4,5-dioxygenase alpha chain
MTATSIPGTPIFTGALAMRGYALNRLCYSLNDAANRAAFKADPAAYCARYELTPEQTEAVLSLDMLRMIAAGGSVYYLAKLAGVYGLGVQDIGAQQTGVSLEAFKQKPLEAAH